MENGQERRTWIEMDINTVGWMGHKIQYFFLVCYFRLIVILLIKSSHHTVVFWFLAVLSILVYNLFYFSL